MKILVTGGAGFIGSNFIRYWAKFHPHDQIINFDKLTYAGHLENLREIEKFANWRTRYQFIKGDITDVIAVNKAIKNVDVVVHFAAESHVDRSVIDPLIFVKTNVLGTATLLEAALKQRVKRFHHVSTDEVYGQLGLTDTSFTEETPYRPRTPYAASKAGSDHLVRSFFETYGLPVTISNSANNFGPFHDPEKLIPRFITNLLMGQKVPLMGQGENIREWLYVEDHARAIDLILQKGKVGETYLVNGEERTNLEVTKKILEFLKLDQTYIEYVPHRLGHDFRYATSGVKIKKLGWQREHNFEKWLEKTIQWFMENEWWWKPLRADRPVIDRVMQRSYT